MKVGGITCMAKRYCSLTSSDEHTTLLMQVFSCLIRLFVSFWIDSMLTLKRKQLTSLLGALSQYKEQISDWSVAGLKLQWVRAVYPAAFSQISKSAGRFRRSGWFASTSCGSYKYQMTQCCLVGQVPIWPGQSQDHWFSNVYILNHFIDLLGEVLFGKLHIDDLICVLSKNTQCVIS